MTGTRCSGQMRPKLNCFCQVQHRHVCRRNRDAYKEKNLIPMVKYGGGSVMFWGCFNSRGPGALVRVDGIINSSKYSIQFNLICIALFTIQDCHKADLQRALV